MIVISALSRKPNAIAIESSLPGMAQKLLLELFRICNPLSEKGDGGAQGIHRQG
ncbi:MAG: hypothetical protein KKD64_13855 [Alphaproteobacteria bacterium]|nr:hypothetical protein [Alphaproteobacteria bacterium]MBU1770721.1 hypothetical protein [Alphaproteobacteria bacterium]